MFVIGRWIAVFLNIMCELSQYPSMDGYLRTVLFELHINSHTTHLELHLEIEMGFSVFSNLGIA